MQTKSIFISKTFWFNVFSAIAAIATALGLDLGLTEEVQMEVVAGITAVGNVVLRFVTKQPVKVL